MDSVGPNGNGRNENEDLLPPPPAVVPSDAVLVKAETEKKKVSRLPIARRGIGSKGMKLHLLTNHFKVNVANIDGHFYQYSVALSYEDGRPVEGKGVGRKVLERVQETYDSELNGKDFAYDGEKTLFTLGSLARNKLEFTVVLEDVISSRNNGNCSPDGNGEPNESDKKRIKRPFRAKTFRDETSFALKILLQAIANALRFRSQRIFKKQ
ncbi:Protein argonaute 4, partial [Mucuna pruriens]